MEKYEQAIKNSSPEQKTKTLRPVLARIAPRDQLEPKVPSGLTFMTPSEEKLKVMTASYLFPPQT